MQEGVRVAAARRPRLLATGPSRQAMFERSDSVRLACRPRRCLAPCWLPQEHRGRVPCEPRSGAPPTPRRLRPLGSLPSLTGGPPRSSRAPRQWSSPHLPGSMRVTPRASTARRWPRDGRCQRSLTVRRRQARVGRGRILRASRERDRRWQRRGVDGCSPRTCVRRTVHRQGGSTQSPRRRAARTSAPPRYASRTRVIYSDFFLFSRIANTTRIGAALPRHGALAVRLQAQGRRAMCPEFSSPTLAFALTLALTEPPRLAVASRSPQDPALRAGP